MAAKTKSINLALQGGGAHGAFTWGVLDRLLADDRIAIEGISGTSAGAMNGAMVACGLRNGGREAARAFLDRFWTMIAERGEWSPLRPTPLDRAFGHGDLSFNPAYHLFDSVSRVVSPYFTGSWAQDALRDVLEATLDLGCLQCDRDLKLFVSATNVRTGRIKVFEPHEITVDALLASACLPNLHQAVEIDGEAYWDGGFMGNPALFPILNRCESADIVLVQINPVRREDVPKTGQAIVDRVNEISFNATLLRELRSMAVIDELLAKDYVDARAGLRRMFVHAIAAEADMASLGVSSKLNVDRDFLLKLKGWGESAAETWLSDNFAALGRRGTVDLAGLEN